MFQQRHYNAIAEAIAEASDEGDGFIYRALLRLFLRDNCQFDTTRFKQACKLPPELTQVPAAQQPGRTVRRYWVATYGDNGIGVAFYAAEPEYNDACADAEQEHENGDLDSWTCGWEDVVLPLAPSAAPQPRATPIFWWVVATAPDGAILVSHYFDEASYLVAREGATRDLLNRRITHYIYGTPDCPNLEI